MKKSVKYLPREKQEDLKYLVSMILERIPGTEMIILYGSYATGKYVEFDSRVEFGIRTTYMSDYDILVVTSGAKDKEVGQKLDNIEAIYYKNRSINDILYVGETGSLDPVFNRDIDRQTPVQFINEDIKKLNKDLSDGRYFYTQIKEEGILLYDRGRHKLERRRKLRFDEIAKQAKEYFDEKYGNAADFFDNVEYNFNKGAYKMSSFMLHQTFENLFYAVRLVFTLENNKMHNLVKLLASVRKYSDEFEKLFFPEKTEEERRLFNLVKAAYVEARYNPDFVVTKADIEYLVSVARRLFSLVSELCSTRIGEYERSASAAA
jgi:HEPN domain-containing protein